ncbi:YceD family protein [Rhizobium sp. SGZ-381]|uniref:YceD family protein n=1 Tax=Rhizobium/Agrobacterium group TaxID=227290 RepID=UPI00366A9CFA
MTPHDPSEKPPFSYLVKVGHISANAVTVHVEADERERAALAELWQVLSVTSLKADLQIARWKKDGVRLKGRVEAHIVQACVVTLEPVEADIDEVLEQIFVPEGSKLARLITSDTAEMVLDPEGPDLPETFVGDTIDAGAVVAEFAALAINPYPRKPGSEFADHIEADDTPNGGKPNPFAVLKDWKTKE